MCEKRKVKLWIPYELNPLLLICAECAEKKQIKHKDIPEWRVDDNGKIPIFMNGNKTVLETDQLVVDLSDNGGSKKETLIPACIKDDSPTFCKYAEISTEEEDNWRKLPTR